MASSLSWTHFDEAATSTLLNSVDSARCKEELSTILAKYYSDTTQLKVVVDLSFYNLAFAKEVGFIGIKCSTFLSILLALLQEDSTKVLRDVDESFTTFKRLLMIHSVQRPPWSVGIFEREDITQIVKYVTTR